MSLNIFAAELPAQENFQTDGLVEVQYSADNLVPYKERRSEWGGVFSLTYESMLPTNFKPRDAESNPQPIPGTTDTRPTMYKDMFGAFPVQMIQVSGGPKYNFALGSVAAEFLYAYGQVADAKSNNDYDAGSGLVRALKLQKKGGKFTYAMDNIWKEPIVAPYASIEAFTIDMIEQNTSEDESNRATTALSTAVRGGLLIQLNSIDDISALRASNEMGLNNTFLDIFVSKYNGSTDSKDYDFSTDMNYGAGLKLEY